MCAWPFGRATLSVNYVCMPFGQATLSVNYVCMAFGQATLSVNYVCMAFWTGYSQCELCVHGFLDRLLSV